MTKISASNKTKYGLAAVVALILSVFTIPFDLTDGTNASSFTMGTIGALVAITTIGLMLRIVRMETTRWIFALYGICHLVLLSAAVAAIITHW